MPPIAELPRPQAPAPPTVQNKRDIPHLRQSLPLNGFPTGDFYIQPTITMATDTRYGDPRSRDQSWMVELDSQDARLRGERKDDPLLSFLKGPGGSNVGKSTDPGYQIAATVGHRLQPVPSSTAPLRALERTSTAAPPSPCSKDALRRSVAVITRRPAPADAPQRPAHPAPSVARRAKTVRPPHHP